MPLAINTILSFLKVSDHAAERSNKQRTICHWLLTPSFLSLKSVITPQKGLIRSSLIAVWKELQGYKES